MMKKVFWGSIFLIAGCILFRGWIYRSIITYRSVGQRVGYEATSPSLKRVLRGQIAKAPPSDVTTAIQHSLSLTNSHLEYVLQSNVVDPNVLVNSGKAHCVGYAQFFATAFGQMIPSFSSTGEWEAKVHRAHLYCLGVNVHAFFNSPGFKDHDVVVIRNRRTGQIIGVDPTLADYFLIDTITFRED